MPAGLCSPRAPPVPVGWPAAPCHAGHRCRRGHPTAPQPADGQGPGRAHLLGGRNWACTHTRREKVFLKHAAMHGLILEQPFTSNSHERLLPV